MSGVSYPIEWTTLGGRSGVLNLECYEATEPYLEMKFARPDFKYRIPQWVKIEEE